MPREHTCDGKQLFAHVPQWAGSLKRSTHARPHSLRRGGQTQNPAAQRRSSGQPKAHDPQCASLLATEMQLSPAAHEAGRALGDARASLAGHERRALHGTATTVAPVDGGVDAGAGALALAGGAAADPVDAAGAEGAAAIAAAAMVGIALQIDAPTGAGDTAPIAIARAPIAIQRQEAGAPATCDQQAGDTEQGRSSRGTHRIPMGPMVRPVAPRGQFIVAAAGGSPGTSPQRQVASSHRRRLLLALLTPPKGPAPP